MRICIGRSRAKRWFTLTVSMLLVFATATVSSAAALAPKKKALSMTNVTITGSVNGDYILPWIAQQAGFFKRQGLNVTMLNNPSSSSANIAVVEGGAAQFVIVGTSAVLTADMNGANLRAVAQIDVGSSQVVTINSAAAAAHNIPSVGSTPSAALAQFLALKGSHLTFDLPTTAGDGYTFFVALAKLHGLTVSSTPQGQTADVNVIQAGSSPLALTAMQSGKADGIILSPPTTVQPNTIEIEMNIIPPDATAAWEYLDTPATMISQHSDTVQAIVNGVAEAWQFAKAHPSAAQRYSNSLFANDGGITSPEEQTYLFHDLSVHWPTPAMPKTPFNNLVKIYNIAQPTPVTVTYKDFVYPKFINNAIKTFKLNVAPS